MASTIQIMLTYCLASHFKGGAENGSFLRENVGMERWGSEDRPCFALLH